MVEIELNGKKFEIRELNYLDVIELGGISDKREHAIKIFELSGFPREETIKLSKEDGAKLMEEIVKLNGWSDFQKTS